LSQPSCTICEIESTFKIKLSLSARAGCFCLAFQQSKAWLLFHSVTQNQTHLFSSVGQKPDANVLLHNEGNSLRGTDA
jgi:hypothetical protein